MCVCVCVCTPKHSNTRTHIIIFPSWCRVVTSVSGAPKEYGVDDDKLRPFEKLLQSIEGKLMDGHIFTVRALNVPQLDLLICYVCVHSVSTYA